MLEHKVILHTLAASDLHFTSICPEGAHNVLSIVQLYPRGQMHFIYPEHPGTLAVEKRETSQRYRTTIMRSDYDEGKVFVHLEKQGIASVFRHQAIKCNIYTTKQQGQKALIQQGNPPHKHILVLAYDLCAKKVV